MRVLAPFLIATSYCVALIALFQMTAPSTSNDAEVVFGPVTVVAVETPAVVLDDAPRNPSRPIS